LFYVFTLEGWSTEAEADALWQLSSERVGVRKAFYDVAFSSGRNADRFLAKSDHILQATLGLNAEYHVDF